MKTLALTLLVLCSATAAHAVDRVIRVENFSYPSPAALHLGNLQTELAERAIEACRGAQNVLNVSNITIAVRAAAPGQKLGVIAQDRRGLDLWYPRMLAQATASCRI